MRNENKLDKNVMSRIESEYLLSSESKICFFSSVINIIDVKKLLKEQVNDETILKFISTSILKMSEEYVF